jgi:hypothetical protein
MDGLSLLLRLGTVKRRMRETGPVLTEFRTSLCHRPVSDSVEGSVRSLRATGTSRACVHEQRDSTSDCRFQMSLLPLNLGILTTCWDGSCAGRIARCGLERRQHSPWRHRELTHSYACCVEDGISYRGDDGRQHFLSSASRLFVNPLDDDGRDRGMFSKSQRLI